MDANIVHPTSDTLESFGHGRLDGFSADPVRQHLAECPECRLKVAELCGTAAGRPVGPEAATPGPTKQLSLVSQILQGRPTDGAPVALTVPPELANHPQYEVLRLLGRGGNGVVYLAKNKLMDRLEVLKVINQGLMDKPGSVERFLREIRETAKLSHVNVVKAYSVVQLGEMLAFAMEYVEGEDLGSYVKANGPLPVPYACFYGRQVAQGLQHAFEKGMVHRDIKPQNLMLARDGRKHIVKILDFGLAKATSEKRMERELTGVGRMLGTPDYMAPEQILDASSADIRADIYSLGCTLYYLLTGAPCFHAPSLLELLQAHQSLAAKPLHLVRPEVPVALSNVVAKMMAKDPAQRYQTPAEVAEALKPFVKSGGRDTEAGSAPALSVGVQTAQTTNSLAAAGVGATAALPTAQGWVDDRIASLNRTGGPMVAPTATLPAGTITSGSAPKRGVPWFWVAVLGAAAMVLGLFVVAGVGVAMWAANQVPTQTPVTGTATTQKPAVVDPAPPPVPQEGTLVLQQVPEGAEILIDGKLATFAPAAPGQPVEVRAASGTRNIEVRKAGFKSYLNNVVVAAGGQLPLQVSMEPLQAFIVLEQLPQGADVYIDNIRISYNSPAPGAPVEFPAKPGNHRMEVRKANYKSFFRDVTLAAGARQSVQVYLEQVAFQPQPPPPQPPAGPALIRYNADAVGKFMNQAVVRVTNIANQAKGIKNYGYDNGVSILGGWIQEKKNLVVTYTLVGGTDYLLLAAGDDDATDVDLDVLDANNIVLARDNGNEPDAVVRFTPNVTGKYSFRVSLVRSRQGVPCVCALVILKKDGWNVPVQNLDTATLKVMKALEAGDKEAQKVGKRLDLFQGGGQWAFFGGVLNQGQFISMTNMRLGTGERLFLGVGDNFATVTQLELADATGNQIKRDPQNTPASVLEFNPNGGANILRLHLTQATAPSVVLMAAFDVYVPNK